LIASDSGNYYHETYEHQTPQNACRDFHETDPGGIVFADIESLVKALDDPAMEREGSRVKIILNGQEWRCHRPHPGKEARKYQVEEARELFDRAGVKL
jgi:hypothetical protein